MKTTRKILSILLVLAMVSALFVVGVTADTSSAYQDYSSSVSVDGTYVGLPTGAENVTYLSNDGDDEGADPDLLIGYYTHNESAHAYSVAGGYVTVEAPFAPAWNSSLGKSYFAMGNNYAIAAITKNTTPSSSNGYVADETLGLYREKNGGTWYASKLYLGYNATTKLATEFPYGIGVQPGAESPAYVMFNVDGFDRFYSVVGITGGAYNNQASNVPSGVHLDVTGGRHIVGTGAATVTGADKVTFKVYGSPNEVTSADDASFVLLSEAANIAGQNTSEFNVDISAYKTLKLVAEGVDGKYKGSECAWGNACVYNVPETTHNYTVEYNVSVDGGEYTAITAPEGAPAGEAAVAFGTVIGEEYLNALNLPATVTDGTNTYAYEGMDKVAVTANDTVVKVYYDYWTKYTATENFEITETVNTGCGVEGAVDLADWQYIESSYVMPSGSNPRYVGVNGQYATTNGSTTAATRALGNSVVFNKFYMLHSSPITSTNEGHAIVDVTGLGNRFYAVVGNENANAKASAVIGNVFRVYGSTAADGEWTLLACSGELYGKTTGEFNVDITGYNFLKLEVDTNRKANEHGSRSILWGNPAVYTGYDYTVNYDGNGGKTADDETTLSDSESVANHPSATLSVTADACTFAKEGYIFDGWNTKADGTGTAYAAAAEIALTSEANEITLYAQWEEKAADVTYYTVTYVADGETIGTPVEVEAGKDVVLPEVPEKEGYTGKWNHDGKNITENTTITAVYTIKTYTVTFKVEGQDDTTVTVEHGKDATLPEIPAKKGYNGSWDHDGKAITADTTITATYKRVITTVKVNLEKDPGSAPKGDNKTYLSDLHDASEDGKNLGLNKYVIDQGNNSKIILDNSYSQPSYYFIDGGRKVGTGNGVDADGYRVFTRADGSTIKIHKNQVVLGYTGTLYEKALGVHPNAKGKADRYIVYDISSLDVNAFYAVAGATGAKLTIIDTKNADYNEGRGVTFEVWGSMDETYDKNTTEFVKLAYVDEISGYNVGEFKVNLEGINFLKLVVKVSPDATTNDSSAVAWGGAMVYKAENSADTSDGFSMTAVAAAIVAATSVVALVVTRKKFF